MSHIQTVIIPKDRFSINQAIKWIRAHGFIENFHHKGIDITDKYYRFRQSEPKQYGKYYTKILENGIHLVIELK